MHSIKLNAIYVYQYSLSEPTEAPVLFIKDQYDFYEITVQWNETSYNSSRGEVLGYKVRYWPQEINDEAVFQPAVSELNILAPGKSVVLKGLTPYTKYGIQILSYTEGGFGIISETSWAGKLFVFVVSCCIISYVLNNNLYLVTVAFWWSLDV